MYSYKGNVFSCGPTRLLENDYSDLRDWYSPEDSIGLYWEGGYWYLNVEEAITFFHTTDSMEISQLDYIASHNTGIIETYFTNGSLGSRGELNDGILNGDFEHYNRAGYLLASGTYVKE